MTETSINELMNKYEPYFHGYDVPLQLKRIATLIMFRFAVNGICDGMYICNSIAVESGMGDGAGHFTEGTINAKDSALFLQYAYGRNIQKDELHELKAIIETGNIDDIVARFGMEKAIRRYRQESLTCDILRKEYLRNKIKLLKDHIADLYQCGAKIRWFLDGVKQAEASYSDKTLISVIQEESKKINHFAQISLWFMESENDHGCIAIDISEEDCKLDNHKMLTVYDFDLTKQNFSDYVKEGQRIKQLIQKNFPSIRVTSNFR